MGHTLQHFGSGATPTAPGAVVQLAKGVGFHERIRRIKAARKAAEQARHAEKTDPNLIKERKEAQQERERKQKERAERFHRTRPKPGERPVPRAATAAPTDRPASAPPATAAPPAAEPAAEVRQPIDLAALKRKSAREIGDAFRAKYGEELGGRMGRLFRSRGSHMSESALKRAAAERTEAPSGGGSGGGGSRGRLNTRGTVSGLKKGKGAGWLAGSGAHWHVHFDHAKPGTSKKNRVNFAGRSQAQVLAQMDAAHAAKPTAPGSVARGHWDASRKYVVDNPGLFS